MGCCGAGRWRTCAPPDSSGDGVVGQCRPISVASDLGIPGAAGARSERSTSCIQVAGNGKGEVERHGRPMAHPNVTRNSSTTATTGLTPHMVATQHLHGNLAIAWQERLPERADLRQRDGDIICAGETTGDSHRPQAGRIHITPDGQVWRDVPVSTDGVLTEEGPSLFYAGVWVAMWQQECIPAAICLVDG